MRQRLVYQKSLVRGPRLTMQGSNQNYTTVQNSLLKVTMQTVNYADKRAGATIHWICTVLVAAYWLSLSLHIWICKLSVDPDSGDRISFPSHIIMTNVYLVIRFASVVILQQFPQAQTHTSFISVFLRSSSSRQLRHSRQVPSYLNWCFDLVLFYYLYILVSCLPSVPIRVVYSDSLTRPRKYQSVVSAKASVRQ